MLFGRKAKIERVDRLLLLSIAALAGGGFFIFLSAAMGLVARTSGASFGSVVWSQTFLGLVPGLILMYLISRINIKKFKAWSPYILLAGIILTLLVFVPGIGFSHGGAKRWIALGTLTFQPSEFLKLGIILFLSAWYSSVKGRADSWKYGALPLLITIGVSSLLLVFQPDMDTLFVIVGSSLAVYLVAGARWKHIGAIVLGCIALVSIFAAVMPYFRARIMTYIHPSSVDALGAGYQIKQSLIAIGSGGILGKGFGQSVQKFSYLPEAIGDSIFAVAGEEFGFLGTVGIVLAFALFASRALVLGSRTDDLFPKLLTVGIVTMIIGQSFINIGAMLHILPLSGIPLSFISHGGTALLFNLIEAGLLLSISRTIRHKTRVL